MPNTTLLTLQNRLLSRARFRHMQVMVAVVELGSLRRAADTLGMSQPAVSKVLADLESLLELTLFERHARGVHATRECLELLVLARMTVNGVATAAAAVAARNKGGEGSVRVAGTTAALNGLLAGTVRDFSEKFPAVQVQVSEAPVDDVLLAAARGEVDVVLCRKLSDPPEGWQFHALLPDDFAVFCSPEHPLARRRKVTAAELMRECWLPGHAAAASRRYLDRLAEETGQALKLREVMTVVSDLNWFVLRKSRLLMLAPRSVFRPHLEAGELAIVKFERTLPFEPLGVLLPTRPAQPAAARLVRYLHEVHGAGDSQSE
jgi:DNA-binding transcriptional LysR family regulator